MLFKKSQKTETEKHFFLKLQTITQNDDLVEFKKLVSTNFHINSKNSDIFIYAINNNSINIINYLITVTHDINMQDGIFLKQAAHIGNISIINTLLDNGASINNNEQGILKNKRDLYKKLEETTENDDLVEFKYLVKYGANIHLNNDYIFILAVENNSLQIIEHLISLGLDVNMRDGILLKNAKLSKKDHIVNILINNGANVNFIHKELEKEQVDLHAELEQSTKNDDLFKFKELIKKGANSHYNNDYIFIFAVSNNSLDIVDYLISLNFDVNMRDGILLKNAFSKNNFDIAHTLLENGADLDILLNSDSLTPKLEKSIEKYQEMISNNKINNKPDSKDKKISDIRLKLKKRL